MDRLPTVTTLTVALCTFLSDSIFYVFSLNEVAMQCFNETSGRLFDCNMIVNEKAYAVHLTSKVTDMEGIRDKLRKGTICKPLLSQSVTLTKANLNYNPEFLHTQRTGLALMQVGVECTNNMQPQPPSPTDVGINAMV